MIVLKCFAVDLHCNVVMLSQKVCGQFVSPNFKTAVLEYGTLSKGALTVTTNEPVVGDGTRNNGTREPRMMLFI